jgi:hypothetical protein
MIIAGKLQPLQINRKTVCPEASAEELAGMNDFSAWD